MSVNGNTDNQSQAPLPLGIRVQKLFAKSSRSKKSSMWLTLNFELCELAGLKVGDRVQVSVYADGTLTIKKAGEGL